MYRSIIAVALGGALGALARWALSVEFNGAVPHLPFGTFLSNVIAGYIIGAAIAVFARLPEITPQWRLFVITGLMGGLSTFSTFSAEVVAKLQRGQFGWALAEVAIHVAASLAMTTLGIASVAALMRRDAR